MNRSRLANIFLFGGNAFIMLALILASLFIINEPRDWPRMQRINCVNNLKQIGLSLGQWSLDHDDQYPFRVSTNAGGTKEFCTLGSDGFDSNSALHFIVMSNELNTPLVLLCPKDRSRKAATNFASLQPANVSYRLRTGPEVSYTNRQTTLVVCAFHGNFAKCDASVTQVTKDKEWPRPAIFDLMEWDHTFKHLFVGAVISSIAAIGFLATGLCLKWKGGRSQDGSTTPGH